MITPDSRHRVAQLVEHVRRYRRTCGESGTNWRWYVEVAIDEITEILEEITDEEKR